MKLTLIAIACAYAACGSSSSKPGTMVATTDPVPMTEPVPVAPTEPANPVDPVKPVEPAQPAQAAAPDPAKVKADLLAVELAAFERAKPVFDKYCARCHSKDGAKQSAAKREHFDMTTYPFGGHHAMDVHNEIREVLGVTGKKPTMPVDKKGVDLLGLPQHVCEVINVRSPPQRAGPCAPDRERRVRRALRHRARSRPRR